MSQTYDAFLLVSFGGPEGPDDVIPFLENVLRGKNVPRERMLEVAEHYYHFGGKSPINDQNRALMAALRTEFDAHGIHLPIYWGNRNWHPLLADTLRQMQKDGVKRAAAYITSAFSSYSGCRQYQEDIARARAEIGEGAPEVIKLRTFHNHPGFIEANAARVREALAKIPGERRRQAKLAFTAHSIPTAMASASRYVPQLREACTLIGDRVGRTDWELVYQSRSGPPTQPWLEPDIGDAIRSWHAAGVRDLVISPVGFISDHMEVLYDLDTEARELCAELGMNMIRAGTPGVHPLFVSMIRELLEERLGHIAEPRALGPLGPGCEVCPPTCCPPPQRPAAVRPAAG
jgi:ferrochelatase